MNSNKNWAVFEDDFVATKTSQQLFTLTETESETSSVSSMDSLSSGSEDQLSRYSVFDNLRQRERNGEYLGWSSDILGEGQSGWTEEIRRKSL